MEDFHDTVAYMQRNGGYQPHTEREIAMLKKTALSTMMSKFKRTPSNVSGISQSSGISQDSDGSSAKKLEYPFSIKGDDTENKRFNDLYTIRVPESALQGQILKVTDPTQTTVLSVVLDENVKPGDQLTFAPNSHPVNDHAEGYRLKKVIGEEELLHQIRVQNVDEDMERAQMPLVQAYAQHQKSVRWTMSAEERLLRELIIERLDPARPAPPGVICSAHLFTPDKEAAWVSSVEDWHRARRPQPAAPAAAAEGNDSARLLLIDPRLQRRLEPVEPACEAVAAVARAVRLSMRRARESHDAGQPAAALAGEVDPVHVWPADTGGNAFRVECYAPRLFCRVRDALGLTVDAVARELDPAGGVWRSGGVHFFGGAQRLCLQAIGEEELRTVVRMLAAYAEHVRAAPDTLLPHWCGLFATARAGRERRCFALVDGLIPAGAADAVIELSPDAGAGGPAVGTSYAVALDPDAAAAAAAAGGGRGEGAVLFMAVRGIEDFRARVREWPRAVGAHGWRMQQVSHPSDSPERAPPRPPAPAPAAAARRCQPGPSSLSQQRHSCAAPPAASPLPRRRNQRAVLPGRRRRHGPCQRPQPARGGPVRVRPSPGWLWPGLLGQGGGQAPGFRMAPGGRRRHALAAQPASPVLGRAPRSCAAAGRARRRRMLLGPFGGARAAAPLRRAP